MSSPKLFYREISKCSRVIYIQWFVSLHPEVCYLRLAELFKSDEAASSIFTIVTPRTSHYVLRNAKPLRSSLAQVPEALGLHNAMRDQIATTMIIPAPPNYLGTGHESLQAYQASSKIYNRGSFPT
jgi:hypothetical protein